MIKNRSTEVRMVGDQKQRLRKNFLRVLKYTLNPLTRRMARSNLGPFSIIRHVGRRSGKLYETPIISRN